jgi:flagellar hook-associated protein 3 FlgL
MNRISTNLPNDNLQFHTRNRQVEMNESQKPHGRPDPDPQSPGRSGGGGPRHPAAELSHRLERFSENIETSINQFNAAEGQMRHAVDLLQEIRQIAVMGGNGTYTRDDLMAMGRQVDELLREFINTANATDAEGLSMFSGNRTRNLPYRVIEGRSPGAGENLVTNVEYIGDIGVKRTEIADGKYIEMNFPGNQVFWAENQQIYSQTDAGAYVVQNDSEITVTALRCS